MVWFESCLTVRGGHRDGQGGRRINGQVKRKEERHRDGQGGRRINGQVKRKEERHRDGQGGRRINGQVKRKRKVNQTRPLYLDYGVHNVI